MLSLRSLVLSVRSHLLDGARAVFAAVGTWFVAEIFTSRVGKKYDFEAGAERVSFVLWMHRLTLFHLFFFSSFFMARDEFPG